MESRALILAALIATTVPGVLVLDMSDAPAGRYYYAVDVTELGEVTATRLTQVASFDGDTTEPQPPIEPPTGEVEEKLDEIIQDCNKLDGKVAEAVRRTYATVAEWIPDRLSDAKEARRTLIATRMQQLAILQAANEWESVSRRLDEAVALLSLTELKRAYAYIGRELAQ